MEYLLENEFLQAAVSSQGAELVSIRDKAAGRELMWQADAGVWGRHAPILFPYCGRLRGGAFTHRGVRYEGGQHGFARDMEHALVEKMKRMCRCALRPMCSPWKSFLLPSGLSILIRWRGAV